MSPYTPDEAPYGVWAWIGLIVLVNAYWIGFDIWARINNHEYMTTEFREALNNPVLGPVVMGLCAFTVVAFLTHMLQIGKGLG